MCLILNMLPIMLICNKPSKGMIMYSVYCSLRNCCLFFCDLTFFLIFCFAPHFVSFLSRPSVILGVTNPFFAKTLQHWPHIIRIEDLKPAGNISTWCSQCVMGLSTYLYFPLCSSVAVYIIGNIVGDSLDKCLWRRVTASHLNGHMPRPKAFL